MGEVGRLNLDLFAQYRRAREGSRRRRRLLGELVCALEPLLKSLCAQLRGHAAERPGRVLYNCMRAHGAEKLPWEDALNVSRAAALKALEQFDPSKGRFAFYLKTKMRYALQCEVREASIVKVPRGTFSPSVTLVDDDTRFDRFVTDEEEDNEEPPRTISILAGTGAMFRHLKPANTIHPPDDRTALEIFLSEHLRFVAGARVAAVTLVGRYRSIAGARGEAPDVAALRIVLEAHGVRPVTLRTPWSHATKGFAGVGMQSVGAAPPGPAPVISGGCLATGHGGHHGS